MQTEYTSVNCKYESNTFSVKSTEETSQMANAFEFCFYNSLVPLSLFIRSSMLHYIEKCLKKSSGKRPQ